MSRRQHDRQYYRLMHELRVLVLVAISAVSCSEQPKAVAPSPRTAEASPSTTASAPAPSASNHTAPVQRASWEKATAVHWRPKSRSLLVEHKGGLELVDLNTTPPKAQRLCEGTRLEPLWDPGGKVLHAACDGPDPIWKPDATKSKDWGGFVMPHSSLSPDGSVLLISTAALAWFWIDTTTSELITTTAPRTPGLTGGSYPYWSPDGTRVLIVQDGGALTMMSGKTWKVRRDLKVSVNLPTVEPEAAWHPKGTSVAVVSDYLTVIFDKTGRQLFIDAEKDPENADTDGPSAIQYGNDGKTLVALRQRRLQSMKERGRGAKVLGDGVVAMAATLASDQVLFQDDRGVHAIQSDGSNERELLKLERAADDDPARLLWLPDGKTAVVVHDGSLWVLDSGGAKTKIQAKITPGLWHVALSPDGAFLALAGERVQVARLKDGTVLTVYSRAAAAGPSKALFFTDDGRFAGDSALAQEFISPEKRAKAPAASLVKEFFASGDL